MENNEDDFSKMLEKAATISKLMGKTDNENVMDDFQKAADFAKLLKTFSGTNEETAPEEEREKSSEKELMPQYFDDEIISPELKALKSAVVHMDVKHQKPLGMFIKLIELQKIAAYYDNLSVQSVPASTSEERKKEMIKSMKIHMSEENKCKADIMLKAMEIMELLSKLKEVN